MPLTCVPLLPEMTGSTAEDCHAIYRRRKETNFGVPILDADGREQWDLTGPLPLRRHEDYVHKGFEYVTLADEVSLQKAGKALARAGYDWRAFANQDPRTRSPFNQALYLEDARSNQARDLDELRADIAAYGVEAVVALRRRSHPGFVLPAALRPQGASPPETTDDAALGAGPAPAGQTAPSPRRRGRPRRRAEVPA